METYGLDIFPPGTPQHVIELKCFQSQRDCNNALDLDDAHIHLERFMRYNWPEGVAYEAVCRANGKTYDNTFVREVLERCCNENELILTGSASAGKTLPVSAYSLASFYAAPNKTTVLTSTTSSSGADGRIWGAIRDLHAQGSFKVGTPIDYIKSIVFDPGKEIEGKARDTSQRDLRNALLVVPIGRGSEGRAATRALIGRKNQHIIWVVDELPEMDDGILEDTMANLENNPYFQFIGIGNAASRFDPHGQMCEPEDGWDSQDMHNRPFGGEWRTKTGGLCLFLDGHRSPNMTGELLGIEDKNDLPFPYLSNNIGHEKNAKRYGHGDIELGQKTLPYLRMSRGIWPGDDIEQTVLNRRLVKHARADEDTEFTHRGYETLCACDPAFSIGGDNFVLQFGKLGVNWDGFKILRLGETVTLNPMAGEEYAEGMAGQVVSALKERGVKPSGFGLDVSSDGGVIGQAISRIWDTHSIHMISSLGKPTSRVVSREDHRSCSEAYDRAVTEYWFQVRVGVLMGHIKNFNVDSAYAKDMFARLYSSKASGDIVAVESKKEMKPRIKRSPDHGDALAYLVEIAFRNGLSFTGELDVKRPDPSTMDPVEAARSQMESGYDVDVFDVEQYELA